MTSKDLQNLDKLQPRVMDTTVLAYIGDAVYEVYIRSMIVSQNPGQKAGDLHRNTVKYVQSEYQAEAIRMLDEMLTEEEKSIVRRARNKKSISKPKHASPMDYKLSTAFEALIGYLHIDGQVARKEEIIQKSIEIIESL